jgi:hypothetical protein
MKCTGQDLILRDFVDWVYDHYVKRLMETKKMLQRYTVLQTLVQLFQSLHIFSARWQVFLVAVGGTIGWE